MNLVKQYKYKVKKDARAMINEAKKALQGDGSMQLKTTGPAFKAVHDPNDAYKKVVDKIP